MRALTATAAVVFLATITACATVKVYAPTRTPTASTGWPRGLVRVVVQDARPDRVDSEKLRTAVQDVLAAATNSDSTATRYTLTVAVLEHRAYFSFGTWNARTRLRATLTDGNGREIGSWAAQGEASRMNTWGYSTAARVSEEAFELAVADLTVQLAAVKLTRGPPRREEACPSPELASTA